MIVLSYVRFVFHYYYIVSVCLVVPSLWSMRWSPRLQIKTGGHDVMAFRRYFVLYSIFCIEGWNFIAALVVIALVRDDNVADHYGQRRPFLHYRLIFYLGTSRRKKRNVVKWWRNVVKYGKYSLAKLATSYTNEKICKLCRAIFSTHYNIFQPNFRILLLLKCSLRECSFLLTR